MNRRVWYWERQGRRCYLQIHHLCRTRGGRLIGGPPATWDHVLPACREPKGVTSIKLLACQKCNLLKGDADPALEHLERALELGREWFTLHGDSGRIASMEAEAAKFRDRLAAHETEAAAMEADIFAALGVRA